MEQLSSSSSVQRSPMSIVREHWIPNSKNHPVYFSPEGVRGPGFGNDNPAILADLAPLLEIIQRRIAGTDFFISMIPEENYSFGRANIPKTIEVPAFGAAFAPIMEVLINQEVQNDCDIEISVRTGRGGHFGNPTHPSLELFVYERTPAEFGRYERRRLFLPVALDTDGDECKSILAWYSGAAHGMVSWTWKRQRRNQKSVIACTDTKLLA